MTGRAAGRALAVIVVVRLLVAAVVGAGVVEERVREAVGKPGELERQEDGEEVRDADSEQNERAPARAEGEVSQPPVGSFDRGRAHRGRF